MTRSRRTDLGSRLVFVGLEGPAWDDEARIWVVGAGRRWLARRVRVVGFIVCVGTDGIGSRLADGWVTGNSDILSQPPLLNTTSYQKLNQR